MQNLFAFIWNHIRLYVYLIWFRNVSNVVRTQRRSYLKARVARLNQFISNDFPINWNFLIVPRGTMHNADCSKRTSCRANTTNAPNITHNYGVRAHFTSWCNNKPLIIFAHNQRRTRVDQHNRMARASTIIHTINVCHYTEIAALFANTECTLLNERVVYPAKSV